MVTRKKKKKKIVVFLLLFIICMIFWIASIWVRIFDRAQGGDTLPRKNGITNVLIIGLDQSDGLDQAGSLKPADEEPGRADTIIILSIFEKTGAIALVSVPRDSRVEIPGYKTDKINHAMQFGGVSLLRQTVENLLGVPVHHYLYTNFTGFARIIDAVGGVDVDVEREITGQDDRPIVRPGLQRLTGRQALSYVRFRSDAEGDFGRMRRQQQVLKAIARRVSQTESLLRLPSLAEQLARHVRTDMSPLELAAFGRTVAALDLAVVPAVLLRGSVVLIDGISYVVLDEAHLQDTVRRYLRWENQASKSNLAV